MNFHEVRFPVNLSFGSVGGPERKTEIVTLASGFEERNTPWTQSRRRYDAGLGMRSLDDLAEVIAFFEARIGQLYGFRWKDWTDFKSCLPSDRPDPMDQRFGIGDGESTIFQLSKSYHSGNAMYERSIRKPVEGTVLVAIGGDQVEEGLAFEIDPATGLVSFAAPPAEGAELTAGFEFDVPVRFDTDRIAASVENFAAGEVPSVPVAEVRV